MKKIQIYITILFLSVLSGHVFGSNNINNQQEFQLFSNKCSKVSINVTLTSDSGCEFAIVGNYNGWTGVFTGSVTASGGGDCPNGKWTFSVVNIDDDPVVVGDNPFVKALQTEPQLLADLVRQFNIE
jgi:hypothetical protein